MNQGLQGTRRRDLRVGAVGSAGHRKWRLERGGDFRVSTGRERGTSCTTRSLADQRREPLRVSPSSFYFRGLISLLPRAPSQWAYQHPGPHPFWRQQLGARATGSTARAKRCPAHARSGCQRPQGHPEIPQYMPQHRSRTSPPPCVAPTACGHGQGASLPGRQAQALGLELFALASCRLQTTEQL